MKLMDIVNYTLHKKWDPFKFKPNSFEKPKLPVVKSNFAIKDQLNI